jgi:hypothetical protein
MLERLLSAGERFCNPWLAELRRGPKLQLNVRAVNYQSPAIVYSLGAMKSLRQLIYPKGLP